jgi:hypothetical protein
MSIDRQLQEKIYRLETLRKYQAYYGPNTPHQIIAEINQLEVELRRMLKADVTRPTKSVGPNVSQPKPTHKPKSAKPKKKTKVNKKTESPKGWSLSQSTTDIIATVAFIGLVFLLGAIVFAAYVQTRPTGNASYARASEAGYSGITLRPTFTPTADPNNPDAIPVALDSNVAGDSLLPPAEKKPTDIPTPVPTLTPSPPPEPTSTPTSPPTATPLPTKPPPPPPPTATPAPPTLTPAPSFPFQVAEQGNRMFQKTNYHVITVYAAIVSEGNIPIGGLKVVGDHVPSGMHAESGLSTWDWSATNCLDCDYVKFGNVKFEPGTFTDGTWNIYVADEAGNQLSPVVPLGYAEQPEEWVWDFIIFKRSG